MIDERKQWRAEQYIREKNDKLGKSEPLVTSPTIVTKEFEVSLEGLFTLLFWLAFIFLALYEDKTGSLYYSPSDYTINKLMDYGAAFFVMIFALLFYRYKNKYPKIFGALLLLTCFAMILHLVSKKDPWLTENILQCVLTAFSALEGFRLFRIKELTKTKDKSIK